MWFLDRLCNSQKRRHVAGCVLGNIHSLVLGDLPPNNFVCLRSNPWYRSRLHISCNAVYHFLLIRRFLCCTYSMWYTALLLSAGSMWKVIDNGFPYTLRLKFQRFPILFSDISQTAWYTVLITTMWAHVAYTNMCDTNIIASFFSFTILYNSRCIGMVHRTPQYLWFASETISNHKHMA